MSEAIKISGQRVYLRELRLDDVSLEYYQWLNDPEVNRYLRTQSWTTKELKQYVQKQIDEPNTFLLGIFDKENNRHIGNVRLGNIDWSTKRAEFAVLIGNKKYWGKGIGTEVAKLIVDFAFNSLGLDQIEARPRVANERAIRTFEKAGFKIMAVNKHFAGPDGVLRDVVIMVAEKKSNKKKRI